MNFQDLILKKRDGLSLNQEEINFLVKSIADETVPDYQVAALAMAVYFRGMDESETRNLALAMAYSGEVMDLSPITGIKVDKHSTGGVGDKTTIIVLPIVAAAGVPVAKMSGRGLGHTGGTIDKFESIPGFKVEMDYYSFIEQVNSIGVALISQTGNLVPADKKLYAIRDVTGTVDSIPLIASSVMSKKIASGAQAIVLDVKVGQGAFMKNREEANELARTMLAIGKGAGRNVIAVLSDMNQPLGMMIGNSLEVREAIKTLQGNGPADLEELSIHLAANMVLLGGKASTYDQARDRVKKILASGQGLKKFEEWVQAQKGCLDLGDPDFGLRPALINKEVNASKTGYIHSIDALQVGRLAMSLGAGRERIGDVIDHSVGIELLKKQGDYVQKDEPLAIIHSSHWQGVQSTEERLKNAFKLTDNPEKTDPIIIETLWNNKKNLGLQSLFN